MINILVQDEYAPLFDQVILEQAAQAALDYSSIRDEVELSIVADSDERLRELNSQFLGIEASTDVLSFPADEFDPDTNLRYIGDIILSCPKAQSQAVTAGVPLSEELQLLVVHGVLHLLGYDHADETDKTKMWLAQKDILANLGINMRQLPD